MTDPLPNRPVDVAVIGGGVTGLSVAWRLARDGASVAVLDRGPCGRESSWAGAGVLPPASWYVDDPALDALALAACPAHAETSDRLREETGIDDEYARCGAEYHATQENTSQIESTLSRWRRLGVAVERTAEGRWLAPGEAQVRNPRRLRALAAACRARGVAIVEGVETHGFVPGGAGVASAIQSSSGEVAAGAFCFCAGCWTPELLRRLGGLDRYASHARPVRGQVLAVRLATPVLRRIIHRPPYYAVPRRDGIVLVGATVEDVGFDKQTTASALRELRAAAAAIHPALAEAPRVAHWAGLRPASADGLPIIGRCPGWQNVYVATGHHRSGLLLAPPTAELVAAAITGAPCGLPSAPFAPVRFATDRVGADGSFAPDRPVARPVALGRARVSGAGAGPV